MWQEADDRRRWDDIVSAQPRARFLQSWEWGEFQKSLGRTVKRLSWNGDVVAQAIKMPLPLSKYYWYIPHGPLVIKDSPDWGDALKETLNDGALFSRVDPISKTFHRSVVGGIGSAPATQPRCTYVLDISRTEDELLSPMHQKTRYNIRLAEKCGVEINEGSIEEFLRLNKETKARGQFASHPDAYYQHMASSLPKNFIRIWQATYQGRVIASNIIITFGDTATYTHGASSNQHRDVMAPYLLHWHTIQSVKKQGMRCYDFWGVNPKDPRHGAYKESWQGITRFKEGFGGALVCYPRSFDVIYHFWLYIVYTIARNIRRKI
ncbi:MAG: peptidoglycan bridge formation glycyltransferase FemA/FemB family protein [Patescibacteria group bacterium]